MPRIEESDVIKGVVIVAPDSFGDARGRFSETYRREWFADFGGREMIQGNRSEKQAGAVVAFHYHRRQSDYWYVMRGRARVLLHDLRTGSPTQHRTLALHLGDPPHDDLGVYIPPGVAHGFAALTDLTLTYLVDQYYSPDDELGVAWDDPQIAAEWGVDEPVLSKRDQANPKRSEVADALLPRWP